MLSRVMRAGLCPRAPSAAGVVQIQRALPGGGCAPLAAAAPHQLWATPGATGGPWVPAPILPRILGQGSAQPRRWLHPAAGPAGDDLAAAPGVGGGGDGSRVVVYRGRWMRMFRLLVRLKLAQLGCAASLTAPVAAWAGGGMPPVEVLAACGGLGLGAAGASAALWYYSSRYVGELAVLRGGQRVRFSTLDFWGNREDVDVPITAVSPPLRGISQASMHEMAHALLIPVDVEGVRQYVLSLRYGIWVDKGELFRLLDGRMLEEQGGGQAAAAVAAGGEGGATPS